MTITDTQHEVSSPQATESTHEEPKGSPARAGIGLWLAILALVAVMVLATAAALGAFDGSSSDANSVVVDFDERPLDVNPHPAASFAAERPLDVNPRAAGSPAASIAVEPATSDFDERPLDVNPRP